MTNRQAIWAIRGILAVVLGAGGVGCSSDDGGTVPSDGGPSPDGPPVSDCIDSDCIFDQSKLHTFELDMEPEDWQCLQDNFEAEQYVPATLIFEGEEQGCVGVRFKGSTLEDCAAADGSGSIDRDECPKVSMKLKFNWCDTSPVEGARACPSTRSCCVPGGEFKGLRRLNFHARRYDDTKLRERLSYWLFGQMNVPASRATHAKLIVNGVSEGLFGLVEDVDGPFVRRWMHPASGLPAPMDDQGNIYKEIWPVHDGTSRYIEALRRNEDTADVQRMVRFKEALETMTDESFMTDLADWMDVDNLYNYMAVDRFIENWDGVIAFYCFDGECENHNLFWYEESTRDFMWLIPWDLDFTFRTPDDFRPEGVPDWYEPAGTCDPMPIFDGLEAMAPACDDIIRRMATEGWDNYVAASRALLDGPATIASLEARIAEWSDQIDASVLADPDIDYGTWRDELDDLRAELPELRDRIEAQIAP